VQTAISGVEAITCLGDAEQTFRALCEGATGVGPLMRDPDRFGVDYAYEITDDFEGRRGNSWLVQGV
jgi:3-oxoacyl-[acyl-carrier-protein] synthase II